MVKVSVIIPSYNCDSYICTAIESVLQQTYKDYEIIVVDDGSRDNTKKKIKPYLDKGLIQYIFQRNGGISCARNKGVVSAKGEYIFCLDADDEMVPETLKDLVEAAEKTGAPYVVSDILRIESGRKQVQPAQIPPPDGLYALFRREFNFQARFYRRDLLRDLGLYDRDQRNYEDWDLYIRLFERNTLYAYVPKVLYVYKIRQGSITKEKYHIKQFHYIERIYHKHYKRLADAGDNTVAKIYAEVMWRLASDYFHKSGAIFSCSKCLLEALKYDRTLLQKYLKKVLKI